MDKRSRGGGYSRTVWQTVGATGFNLISGFLSLTIFVPVFSDGMTKGYSRVPDSLAIIRAFHAANLALQANVWFNYVATKANVADLPSRGALDEMAACLRTILPSFSLLNDSVEFVIPACPRDLGGLWAAVLRQLPSPTRPVEGGSSRRSRRSGSHRRKPARR